MDFSQFHDAFQKEMSMKSEPSEHEKKLFQKSKRYVARIAHIPGIEMIAVGNSLSMYSTHTDSDIDLFIVTRPGYMWFVRVCVTSIFLIF